MRDDRYRSISGANYHIHLNPLNAPPIHATPNRTGQRQRQLDKEEMDQITKAGVAKPVTTEGELPIVFVQKRTHAFGSLSTIVVFPP